MRAIAVGEEVTWQSEFYSGLPDVGVVIRVAGELDSPVTLMYTVEFTGVPFEVPFRWDEINPVQE